jgi:hypothetical protein
MASLRTDMIGDVWISTAYRITDIQGCEVGYYEIIVWDYNHDTKEVGKIRYMNDVGSNPHDARMGHERIVEIFRYLEYRKRRKLCKKYN